MSLEVRYSSQSRLELNEIWDFIADDSEKAADLTVDRIFATCSRLSDTPQLGRRRDELGLGWRSFPVGKYLIFYRVELETVDILRVLHGARNLKELLSLPTDEDF